MGSRLSRGLNYAVLDYLRRKQRPVVVLHSSAELDAVLYNETRREDSSITYTAFGNGRKNYQPFVGMDVPKVVEAIKGQCKLNAMLNETDLAAYATCFLTVLAQFEKEPSLHNIFKLSRETNEQIVRRARYAGQPQNIISGIETHAGTGEQFAGIIKSLVESLKNSMYSPIVNAGQSICSCFQKNGNRQVISLNIGAYNTSAAIRCLADELAVLSGQEFLLVIYDVDVDGKNGLKELLTNRRASYSIGLCSEEIRGMFENIGQDGYNTVRARMTKKVIFSYTDAEVAKSINNIAGEYEKTTKVKQKAPHMPWNPMPPAADTKAKVMMPKIEASEICEMKEGAAMLYGHAKDTIYFVRRLYY